jgi:hypothetical protein
LTTCAGFIFCRLGGIGTSSIREVLQPCEGIDDCHDRLPSDFPKSKPPFSHLLIKLRATYSCPRTELIYTECAAVLKNAFH